MGVVVKPDGGVGLASPVPGFCFLESTVLVLIDFLESGPGYDESGEWLNGCSGGAGWWCGRGG